MLAGTRICARPRVFLAGQVAWNADKEIGDATDLGSQTRGALHNIELALREVDGGPP